MGDLFKAIAHAIRTKEPVAVVTEVQGPNPGAKMLVGEESVMGSLGDEGLDSAVVENARGFIDMAQTGTRTYGPQGQGNSEEVEVFIQAFSHPPDLYVLGAVNLANAVVRLGK
ncbi:MAG TPA: XdhC family protein, partial [Actinomycetota bacterium]|nr:XdhC family protein [Actinomycetota bacterium]